MKTIDLIATMLCSGGPVRMDALNHRNLHRALCSFFVEFGHVADGEIVLRPDPEVGVRVPGVTRALWKLCELGVIKATDRRGSAEFTVQPQIATYVAEVSPPLPVDAHRKLQCVAKNWAAAELTDLKKSRHAAL
jgi:hypothetical protein